MIDGFLLVLDGTGLPVLRWAEQGSLVGTSCPVVGKVACDGGWGSTNGT